MYLKCTHAHNYMSWLARHTNCNDSTLGTWQTATQTQMHACAKQQRIICATEGSNLMQSWLHGEENHPIHAGFLTFPHTHANQTVSRNMLTS